MSDLKQSHLLVGKLPVTVTLWKTPRSRKERESKTELTNFTRIGSFVGSYFREELKPIKAPCHRTSKSCEGYNSGYPKPLFFEVTIHEHTILINRRSQAIVSLQSLQNVRTCSFKPIGSWKCGSTCLRFHDRLLRPWRLTCNQKITKSKREIIFQTSVFLVFFGFHF